MFLFNNTVGIDKVVEEEWLVWMRNEHIPEIMSCGLFSSVKFYKVLHDNPDETVSYSVQFFTDSIDKIQHYLDRFAPQHVAELHKKFKDRHVAFRTLLQEI